MTEITRTGQEAALLLFAVVLLSTLAHALVARPVTRVVALLGIGVPVVFGGIGAVEGFGSVAASRVADPAARSVMLSSGVAQITFSLTLGFVLAALGVPLLLAGEWRLRRARARAS